MAVNLDYIVSSILSATDDHSSSDYDKLLHFAVRGFKKLNLMVLPSIQVAYIPISDTHTIDLPRDYVSYTKVGVVIGGNIWTLSLNKEMPLPRHTDECGELIPNLDACQKVGSGALSDTATKLGKYYYMPHWRNGQYVGEQFGIGGGFNKAGYFRVDEERGMIHFTNTVPKTEIVLEYKSNGLKVDGGAVVPEEAIEAMIAFVNWQRIEYNDRMPQGEKERKRMQWITEYELLNSYTLMFTKDEYLDMVYSSSKVGVKR